MTGFFRGEEGWRRWTKIVGLTTAVVAVSLSLMLGAFPSFAEPQKPAPSPTSLPARGIPAPISPTATPAKHSRSFIYIPTFSPTAAHVAVNTLTLLRYPYVQNQTTSAITIIWKTDQASTSEVQFGRSSAYGRVKQNDAQVTQHEVRLRYLRPGTTYHYRILSDGQVLSGDITFATAPQSVTEGFTFVVFGDSGTGSQEQHDIATRIKQLNPDLLLHTGDVVYPSGAASNYQRKFFRPYRGIIKSKPIYPSLGNHDMITDNGAPYIAAFSLPRSGQGAGERYYSFDYGNAHFIALDTNQSYSPGSAQYNWLAKDLATTSRFWKIIFFHHPPYNSGNHGSDLNIRSVLSPLFERFGVDIVFNGHAHSYERTIAVKDYSPARRGVVYVITGGGGAGLRSAGSSPWTAFSASVHHVVKVDINSGVLTLQAINADGSTFDSFTIDRSDSFPPPSKNFAIGMLIRNKDSAQSIAPYRLVSANLQTVAHVKRGSTSLNRYLWQWVKVSGPTEMTYTDSSSIPLITSNQIEAVNGLPFGTRPKISLWQAQH